MKHTKYYASSKDFNPEEFEFVEYFDMKSPIKQIKYTIRFGVIVPDGFIKDDNGDDVLTIKGKCLQMLADNGYGKFESHCQHCGKYIRHCCVFRNTVHNELIVVGEVCADTRMDLTFDQWYIKKEKTRLRQEESKRLHAEGTTRWLNEVPDRSELIAFLEANRIGNRFYNSLYEFFRSRRMLTTGQEEALRKSIAKSKQRAQEKAQQLVNTPVVPTQQGLKVEGKVISTKWQDNNYGGCYKMLIETTQGYRLWGTVPSNIDHVEAGDTVALTANTKQSDNDKHFGFFSRPRKASITAYANPPQLTWPEIGNNAPATIVKWASVSKWCIALDIELINGQYVVTEVNNGNEWYHMQQFNATTFNTLEEAVKAIENRFNDVWSE